MNYANMHLHSFFSDGVFTPLQLCELAKQKGYSAISLSDHETARGNGTMRKAAEQLGLGFIAGMETYAYDFGASFHILAYDFDPDEPKMRAYTDQQEQCMTDQTKQRFDACVKSGAIRGISWQDVLDRFPDVGWFCNEQIFDTMKALTDTTEADYWEFIRAFHSVKVADKSDHTDSKSMISLIRNAGGVAVLAHPHKQTQYLPDLLKNGLNGVESCHPDIDEADELAARAFAREHRIYTTGGTDHTGLLGTRLERGDGDWQSDGALIPYTVDVSHGASKEEFEALLNRIYG